MKFLVIGKRWFERTNGNTYHSVEIRDAEGNKLAYVPFEYGYDEGYQQTALDWLRANGHIPQDTGYGWQVLKEYGIQCTVSDVARKKDL